MFLAQPDKMLYKREEMEKIVNTANMAMRKFSRDIVLAVCSECERAGALVEKGKLMEELTEGEKQGFLVACRYFTKYFADQWQMFKDENTN